ncbi:MAG TPA: penicillin acylase family protein [Streptosporangiaceae bacterium]|nr:penicillin acylase family protein [Streptosporangiaceae bacterium]
MPSRRRWRRARRIGNVAVAAGVAAAVLAVCAAGYGRLPALGPVLDPGRGAWASAAGGQLPTTQVLTLPGLGRAVTVGFDAHGIATIDASSVTDAMLALGYLHARFRLTEMDLERRQAEGRLAQLVGPAALPSDRFELRLGLLRTARREWAEMPRTSVAARALLAYARGVNDYLDQARASGQWPALFPLEGVYPADWTPVDSLAIQGDLTQELDYTTTPLDYALLDRSLGAARTMSWFPVLPVNAQSPYDPGPYRPLGIAPIQTTMVTANAASSVTAGPARGGATPPRPAPSLATTLPPGTARAAATLLAQAGALPAGQIHEYPDSNAWAANGPRVRGGGAMLAGDPHLPQTLPSVWYQVAMMAPGFDVTGVSVPGLPGVLLGHNKHIAWSLTDTQNQSTLFYVEKTSRSRPGQYLWHSRWRRMRTVRYTIPVRGGAPRHLAVKLTVHGPVMTQVGQTVSVDWMGNVPSPDVAVLFGISTASDFAQFRAALANWRAPTQNFVYADDRGNIGAISAGYFPVVRHGAPWLPMPGTGADDVAGVIPYAAVPHSYDPPGHVIATANQRPVAGSYPYYIGTTANDFDPSYRASREYAFLNARNGMTMASFAALQTSVTDDLAVRVLPRVLAAFRHVGLTPLQRRAANVLRRWNRAMAPGSPGASIWWTFWSDYLSATFGPWWRASAVPVHLDRSGLGISASQFSLVQVLEHWTLDDPANPAFTPPGGPRRTAPQVIRAAFGTAVAHLRARLGASPASWAWGRLHSRQFPSLTQVQALGYGPRPSGGDAWTVNAAYGLPVATDGPSWRMIVRWPGTTGSGHAAAEGIYPGGQSENPASPWYENLIPYWWNGRYLPMPAAGGGPASPAARAGSAAGRRVRWRLRP